MEQLLSYINAMPPEARSRFAEDAGSSIGYLRKAVCTGQKLGESLCTRIERATGGAVSADFLRPDITWVRVPDPAWPHPGGRPLVDHSGKHREAA